jgi:hypothetical protein
MGLPCEVITDRGRAEAQKVDPENWRIEGWREAQETQGEEQTSVWG